MAMTFDRAAYEITSLQDVLTPALAIYPEMVRHNIEQTIRLLGNDPGRWRSHVKTAKLESVIRMLVEYGVAQFKCATTLELLVACDAGAQDVLVAYPHTGANARRIVVIARSHPDVRVSVLIDTPEQLRSWEDTTVSAFVDINPGMNRTGIDEAGVLGIAMQIQRSGIEFRGLHYYDGQINDDDLDRRTEAAHRGYDRLLEVIATLDAQGITVREVITAGTPAFPCSITYPGFVGGSFVHRVSPGTVVYNDLSSVSQVQQCDYRPAALVVTRVISHSRHGIVTCDAGHKSLSVDSGVPNGSVLGYSSLKLMKPSEEHLPIEVPEGTPVPQVGSVLYIVPKHVCPTVNNFDYALMIEAHEIAAIERVSARGREHPLLRTA